MRSILGAFESILKVLSFQFIAFILWTEAALAQGMMSGESCPMCGAGMIFGWIFMIAVVVGVVALVVSLMRRGRHSKTGTHT